MMATLIERIEALERDVSLLKDDAIASDDQAAAIIERQEKDADDAEDAEEITAILSDARDLTSNCLEDLFTDAPECANAVRALQEAANALDSRIGRLRPNKQEQKDSDMDDAEMTALIEADQRTVRKCCESARVVGDRLECDSHGSTEIEYGPPPISPVALACMIPTDKIPAAMAALGAELPGDDDPEDPDPELPADYDPGNDLGAIAVACSDTEAFVRLQLYILKLQDPARSCPSCGRTCECQRPES